MVPVWSEARSSLGPSSATDLVVQSTAHVSLANIKRVFQELVSERFCSENTFIFHLSHCQSCCRRTSVAANLSYSSCEGDAGEGEDLGNLGEVGIVDGEGTVAEESGRHGKYGSMAPGQGLGEVMGLGDTHSKMTWQEWASQSSSSG